MRRFCAVPLLRGSGDGGLHKGESQTNSPGEAAEAGAIAGLNAAERRPQLQRQLPVQCWVPCR